MASFLRDMEGNKFEIYPSVEKSDVVLKVVGGGIEAETEESLSQAWP